MRFTLPALIVLALVTLAQDTPRIEPVRPLRPVPCAEEGRAWQEAEIRVRQWQDAYEALSRQWLELPADTRELASLRYEVARLQWENASLRERNAGLAGFQVAADALPAGEFVAIYNSIVTRANECDKRESDAAFRAWQVEELQKLNFNLRRN